MSERNLHPESEQYVLVAISDDNSLLDHVAATLPEPEMFGQLLHQEVYRAMQEVRAADRRFDLLTLADHLRRPMADTLAIFDAINGKVAVRHAPEIVLAHARIVAADYVRREVAASSRKGEDPEALLERMQHLRQRGQDRFFDAQELAVIAFAEAHADHERLSYPFAQLQLATSGGMLKDELVIVAGRPATGKTAWLLQFAWHLAAQGKRVLFVSAEMSNHTLTRRIASHMAGRNLLAPKSEADWDAFNDAIDRLSRTSLGILEVTEVEEIARHLDTHQYDVVFVDYLQQLSIRGAGKGEFELITAITRKLDALSQKHHTALVVASQFSRNAEGQQPSMADLRSSGHIEQAADVIISLWSKPGEQTDPTRAKVYMDILKNRNGYTAINGAREYALWFNKPTFTFHEIDSRRAG